mmetsp:Transcript_492/g.504  ORF Transcript_492/g.504 Transcript_492/m.504 type:complete len:207 (-) Transcript_492:279-899(-)
MTLLSPMLFLNVGHWLHLHGLVLPCGFDRRREFDLRRWREHRVYLLILGFFLDLSLDFPLDFGNKRSRGLRRRRHRGLRRALLLLRFVFEQVGVRIVVVVLIFILVVALAVVFIPSLDIPSGGVHFSRGSFIRLADRFLGLVDDLHQLDGLLDFGWVLALGVERRVPLHHRLVQRREHGSLWERLLLSLVLVEVRVRPVDQQIWRF